MNRPLVPEFIKKFDEKLLLTKPSVWSTRTHFVVWYSISFMVALAGICFISATDARTSTSIETWVGFVVLISFIGFITWMIYLLRFNVFKRFGVQRPGDGLKNFALLFIAMLFIVLPNFIPALVESYRANLKYKNAEIVHDVNNINEKIAQANYASLTKEWPRDTLEISSQAVILTMPNDETLEENMSTDSIVEIYAKRTREYVDTAQLRQRLANADSIVKITDSLYVLYDCPDYAFLKAYVSPKFSNDTLKTAKGIYYSVVKKYKPVDKSALEGEIVFLLKKYRNEEYGNYYMDYDQQEVVLPEARLFRNYKLPAVESGVRNIIDKKERWDAENLLSFGRVLFYFSFCFALLVFIFRHSTRRTFFLTLLTGVILFILSALFINFSRARSESVMFGLLLFYYAFFFFVMFAVFSAKKRSAIHGIALNLVAFFTAFVPLFIAAFYFSEDRYSRYYLNEEYYVRAAQQQFWYPVAEISGILLFIILLEPLFKKLYRRWYALPED